MRISLVAFLGLSLAGGAAMASPESNAAHAESRANLAAFPPADKGMQRWVIHLPKDSPAAWVEMTVGRTMSVDCNQHGLGGKLQELDLQGWGYRYWRYEAGPAFSTMMDCPDGKTQQRWVAGPSQLLPFKARLPVVVYTPAGHEVRYRLLVPGPQLNAQP